MEEKKISEIIDSLLGLRFHEWKSIESLVNQDFLLYYASTGGKYL